MHETAGAFVVFWALTFLLVAGQGYPLARCYNNLIVYSLALPHYVSGELLITLVALVVATVLARKSPRLGVRLFDVVAVLLIACAIADFAAAKLMGMRIEWNLLTMSNDPLIIARMVAPYLLQSLLAVLAVCGLYAGVCWWCSRDISKFSVASRPAFVTVLAPLLLVAMFAPRLVKTDKAQGFAVARAITSSPLAQRGSSERLSLGEFTKLARQLEFDQSFKSRPTLTNAPSSRPNVLLIVLESSYNRYLSLFGAADETQPLLKKYKDRMELFPNFYSNFPNSLQARFSVLSGLYATRD
jgi:glucan phosphoethanolaminetransferase (alkaline phosphatase superfamily)